MEMGPVKTSIGENAMAWGKAIDNSTADQKTQEMLTVGGGHLACWETTALESSDIAAVVKEVILGQNTDFRVQTNKDFLMDEIAAKIKDPACNEPLEKITKWLYWECKKSKP